MQYQEPVTEVLSIEQLPEKITIILKSSIKLSFPIAPAGLYSLEEKSKEVFQLHKLVHIEEDCWTFETYEALHPLPPIGASYIFRSWWTREAFEAVIDKKAKWIRMKYPDNGDHDHCLLTYESISAFDVQNEGYKSSHGWITIDAYETFIKKDCLHLRGKT